eukprot:CAMPEP_0168487824 /NCGR_PEP_ID=MMETSP0228-20121227/67838_1 /TAXON_ID=133427 /ORGANISM="Protoceratium reticulatum, Strain CCCM 535 (=CCMP 1889)" /LENGTH=33 /DNA_ID= /DNA_START= /DNA_END= /DNA_ORIENTATION=
MSSSPQIPATPSATAGLCLTTSMRWTFKPMCAS